MIHDDNTPNIELSLSDTDIDAFLDEVDAAYDALPFVERDRLRKSVQQAQMNVSKDDDLSLLIRLYGTNELRFPLHTCDNPAVAATAQGIASEVITAAKARADALVGAAQDKARDVDNIALKILSDAHRDADAIRALAAAEREAAIREVQQARQEAADIRERAHHVLAEAEKDAAALRNLAWEEADTHQADAIYRYRLLDDLLSKPAQLTKSVPLTFRSDCLSATAGPRAEAIVAAWEEARAQIRIWDTGSSATCPPAEPVRRRVAEALKPHYGRFVQQMSQDLRELPALDRITARSAELPYVNRWPPGAWHTLPYKRDLDLEVGGDASFDKLLARVYSRRRHHNGRSFTESLLMVFASMCESSSLLTVHDAIIGLLAADVCAPTDEITCLSTPDISRYKSTVQHRLHRRNWTAVSVAHDSAQNFTALNVGRDVADHGTAGLLLDHLGSAEALRRADPATRPEPDVIYDGPSAPGVASVGELAESSR